MKKIILFILISCSALFSQVTYPPLISWQDIIDQVANMGYIKFDGTKGIITIPDSDSLDNPNLLINESFEIYTGVIDDGSNDTFTSWTKVNNGVYEAVTGTHGTVAVKLRANGLGTPGVRQNVTVTAGGEYMFRFASKGSVGYGVRYAVYDNSNSAYITNYTAVTLADTNWNNLAYRITAPAGCTSIQLTLLATADTNYTNYIDEVVFSAPYDFSVSFFLRRDIASASIERDYFISRLYSATNNDQRSWSIRSVGTSEGLDPYIGFLRFTISTNGNSTADGVYSSSALTLNKWYHIVCVADYQGSGVTNMKMYLDGKLDQNYNSGYIAWNGTSPLTIGDLVPTPYHPAQSSIAKVQFLRRAITSGEVIDAMKGKKLSNVLHYVDYKGENTTVHQKETQNLADSTGIIKLYEGLSGFGEVIVGDNQEWAHFRFTSAGVVTLITNSTNVSTTVNTIDKVNIYDGGVGVIIQNNLGASKYVTININYNP